MEQVRASDSNGEPKTTSATSKLAALDRLIKLDQGGDDGKVRRVSEMRKNAAYVLLGEPGSGKSSVFAAEAEAAGVKLTKVQAFLNGAKPQGAVLFLDALDEYRADGSEGDKIYKLAAAIEEARPSKWRLSCRSEDWRKAADLEAFSTAAPQVIHLMPLEEDESALVLAALGEAAPEAFLNKARELGAHGLLDNPLSLRLLRTAVQSGGAWPETRFQLFDRACDKLAHDINTVHRTKGGRPSPERILRATERASLFLLLTGARSLWRSNAPAEVGASLSAFDVGVEDNVLNAALDTTLFRGEGEAFEPLHRTIAEFLAARALADAVLGTEERAALPASRALALVTGVDGAPPSELRGLYAWFAAHLAHKGKGDIAARLIEADAFSVLAYGDAGTMDVGLRRRILSNLHARDPYFRMSEDRISALGGLAGEDLAGDFAGIIESDDEESQRLLTVFDALKLGQPVRSLEPLLRRIFADGARPEWVRRRAAAVLQHYAEDRSAEQRKLFDELGAEPKSIGRNQLRAWLIGEMTPDLVTVEDVRAVIADYADLHRPNFVGSLSDLERRLEVAPMPALFETPVSDWLREPSDRQPVFEVRSLLEGAFAAVVAANHDANADQIWRWISNKFERAWIQMPKECAEAVAAWVDVDPQREIELFDVIQANQEETTLWRARQSVDAATHRAYTPLFFETMMTRRRQSQGEARLELSRFVASLAHWSGKADVYWRVYDELEQDPLCEAALVLLTQCEIEDWKIEDAIRNADRRREKRVHRYQNVAELSPLVHDLAQGKEVHHLIWGADNFFAQRERNGAKVTGLPLVASYANEEIAQAMQQGWVALTRGDLCEVTVEMLGAAAAKGSHYNVEAPAMAGLATLMRSGAPFDVPLEMALVAIRNRFRIRDKEEREQVWAWARDRLNQQVEEGSALMARFWTASLKAGANRLEELWPFREDAGAHRVLAASLKALLQSDQDWAPPALRDALSAASLASPREDLSQLAASASVKAKAGSEEAALWTVLRYALGDTGAGALAELCDCGHEDELNWKDLWTSLPARNENETVERARDMIATLGARFAPLERWGERENTRAHSMSEVIRGAIAELSKSKSQQAVLAFAALAADGRLKDWHTNIRHAAAGQMLARRDDLFRHPAPAALKAALSGAAPANAADLKAVALEELRWLAQDLRTGSTSPWKGYWNRDAHGRVTEPLIENECRNHLLERLVDRLRPYNIAASFAEATRGSAGRSDMLIVSHNGRALPVEAKRHDHADLWTAIKEQLVGYMSGADADGQGIYLVFWFGPKWRRLPKRADGAVIETAEQLRHQLIQDLGQGAPGTDVVVLDCSNPAVAYGEDHARSAIAHESRSDCV